MRSKCRLISCVVGRGYLLTSASSWLNSFILFYFIFIVVVFAIYWHESAWLNSFSLCTASFCTPRPNLPATPGISWLPTFAFQSLMMKKTSFLGFISRSYRSSWNCSTSASLALVVGAQTWITVILNALSWKWTEIILPFLRLHPSITFQTGFWLCVLLHFF